MFKNLNIPVKRNVELIPQLKKEKSLGQDLKALLTSLLPYDPDNLVLTKDALCP